MVIFVLFTKGIFYVTMWSMGKTIIEQLEEDIDKNTCKNIGKGLAKGLLSCIPFVGAFCEATLPSLYQEAKKSGFNDYLLGINKRLKDKKFNEKDCRKFEAKLNNPNNFKYLTAIVDSVFFSKSSKARIILGLITADYIDNETIPYKEVIIINALKEMLDDDLDVFVKIMEIYDNGNGSNCEGREGDFYISYYPDQTIINTAFEKLQNLQVFGRWARSTLTSKSPASWHGTVTPITKRLLEYINLCGY